VSRDRAAFFGLAAAIVVADQLSKAWIVAGFPFGDPVDVLGAWVRIRYVANTGALFGLFRDQSVLFAALSVAVMALIVWYHGRAGLGSRWLATLALGLLLGGAVGNFIDRIRLGHVVDFVDMGFPDGWRFYTWNLADAAISTSILLLLLMAIFPPGRRGARAG
jgi:signal peptidase II